MMLMVDIYMKHIWILRFPVNLKNMIVFLM